MLETVRPNSTAADILLKIYEILNAINWLKLNHTVCGGGCGGGGIDWRAL